MNSNQIISILNLYKLPLLLLLFSWANINSGFWNLRDVSTPLGMVHAFRAAMPYVLPFIGLYYWWQAKELHHRLNPAAWLMGYGCVALFASNFSLGFQGSFYFGMAFMMNVLIPAAFFTGHRRFDDKSEIVMLYATWLILGVYVIAIYVFMKDELSVGYGIAGKVNNMTRSSGLARFFGVAGLLCFARIWQGTEKYRWIFAVPLVFCSWVVWNMQSRGGMFGFFAGMMLLFLLSRASWRAYAIAFLAAALLLGSGQSQWVKNRVVQQVSRGQSKEELASMTGRTRAYKAGWEQIKEHPMIGQGNWADRYTIDEHVHNSYLQALMNAGIIGFVPYLISWIMGWWLFYKLYGLRDLMFPIDQQLFIEAGAVMAFFTLRSIPETTTASFSVDSMLMVPVYIYLFVLYQKVRGEWCE